MACLNKFPTFGPFQFLNKLTKVIDSPGCKVLTWSLLTVTIKITNEKQTDETEKKNYITWLPSIRPIFVSWCTIKIGISIYSYRSLIFFKCQIVIELINANSTQITRVWTARWTDSTSAWNKLKSPCSCETYMCI